MNDDEPDGDPVLVRRQWRDCRGEGVAAGGHRNGDGEHVVGEQRHSGDLSGKQTEVVAGDDVGAAGRRVGLDRLSVRQDEEAEHDEQGDRDRRDERERGKSHPGQQDAQDLFGGVGARREVVRGEHCERCGLAECLVFQPLGVQRRAQQLVLDPISQRLWKCHDRWSHILSGDRRSFGEKHTISETSQHRSAP